MILFKAIKLLIGRTIFFNRNGFNLHDLICIGVIDFYYNAYILLAICFKSD